MRIRLLHPQHLERIWSRLTPCRLPFDTLSIQNPCPEKIQEVRERGLASFSVLKKIKSQTWGGNVVKSPRVLGLYFVFQTIPPMPWALFFQNITISKSSLSHLLKLFSTRVLNTY